MLDPLGNLLARAVRQDDGCLTLPEPKPGRYPTMKVNRRTVKAHRFVYESEHGPTDLYICHHCDNPPCFELSHLYAADQAQNMRDMYERLRRIPNRREREPKPPPKSRAGENNPNWKGGVTEDRREWHRQWRAGLTDEQREERRRRDAQAKRNKRAGNEES